MPHCFGDQERTLIQRTSLIVRVVRVSRGRGGEEAESGGGGELQQELKVLEPQDVLGFDLEQESEVPATTTVGEPVYLPPITAEA